MEIKIDILNELREISTVVADIGNKNVYQTPFGYFETLSDLIMNRINISENVDSENEFSFINKLNKPSSFSAPEGYFESFADKMMSRIKAKTEEKTISVSDDDEILFPLLYSINKKMPFAVPPNYFNELVDNIISQSKSVEFINEEELSPLMIGLKNKNVYQTPAGYFDNFSDSVINKINQPQQAKVISFNNKKSWLKYAAAAVVIGVIGTSSFLFFNKHVSTNNNDPLQSLSKLSDQEMVNYLENQSTPVAFSDSSNAIASVDLNNENEDKDLLNDVPDDELQQYADQDVNTKNLIN